MREIAMIKTVYIDILFFENFIIDYFILYLTAFSMGAKLNFLKASISAFIGAFYMCFMFFSEFDIIENMVFKTIVVFAMVFIAFKVKSCLSLIKYSSVFLFFNIVLGGFVYFFSSSFFDAYFKNGVYYSHTYLVPVVLGVALLLCSGKFFTVLFKLTELLPLLLILN